MEKTIRELIEPIIVENGFILAEVKFVKENNTNFLRVVIDCEGHITINNCVLINKLINPILDKEDCIKERYILDICSKEKGSDINGQ